MHLSHTPCERIEIPVSSWVRIKWVFLMLPFYYLILLMQAGPKGPKRRAVESGRRWLNSWSTEFSGRFISEPFSFHCNGCVNDLLSFFVQVGTVRRSPCPSVLWQMKHNSIQSSLWYFESKKSGAEGGTSVQRGSAKAGASAFLTYRYTTSTADTCNCLTLRTCPGKFRAIPTTSCSQQLNNNP